MSAKLHAGFYVCKDTIFRHLIGCKQHFSHIKRVAKRLKGIFNTTSLAKSNLKLYFCSRKRENIAEWSSW